MKKELYKTQISKPLKRNSTWTEREDQILIEKAKEFNYKNWSSVSSFLPGRTPIQCSARYKRIRPGIVKGTWTPQEDAEVVKGTVSGNTLTLGEGEETMTGSLSDESIIFIDPEDSSKQIFKRM